MDELPLELLLAVVGILLLLSAFFSSSETGMMALNRYRLKHLRKQNHKGARRASRLLKRPDRLISLILIGNNLVNFVAASLFTLIVTRMIGEKAAIVVAPVVMTLVFLIFAEITPKTIAAFYPEKIAFPASAILVPMLKILYPVVWMINKVSNLLLRMIGIDTRIAASDHLSFEELRTIVGEAGPHIPQRHQHMLLNILDLEQATVEDIMIPRNEIAGIDLDDSDERILELLRGIEFTRIPVYNEDINNIVGVLHQRNASRVIDNDGNLCRDLLKNEIQAAYFIPEVTPLHTQLMNFQHQKLRMGIVVDEYGVVQGLVTLEDILEEIVGEFTSNLADDEDDFSPQQDGSYIIDGTSTIRDINKGLGWSLPLDGPKTINGLILENLESFPDANVGLKIGDYYFEIEEVKDNIVQSAKAFRIERGESVAEED